MSEVGYVADGNRNHQPIPVDPTPDNLDWNRPYWAHWPRAVSNDARDRLGDSDVTASRHLYEWIAYHRTYEVLLFIINSGYRLFLEIWRDLLKQISWRNTALR